ncbi:hypothetical protein HanPI659440_Chr14g0549531 [Helianthus annuus]|nr:hypothetical protein HanPI659440_Chr14g0549531 [Helianthus annuus]
MRFLVKTFENSCLDKYVHFQSNTSDTNRIQLRDFHGGGMWIYNLPESSRFAAGNPWSSGLPAVKEEEDSSASSSIGGEYQHSMLERI